MHSHAGFNYLFFKDLNQAHALTVPYRVATGAAAFKYENRRADERAGADADTGPAVQVPCIFSGMLQLRMSTFA